MSGQAGRDSFKDRRYVGRKEAASYIVYDASESVNAGVFGSRYNIDILKINLNLYTIISVINGIWDVVNDTFTGPIVDKTRTRWGKFKPYLIAFAIPSLIITVFQWSLPFFLDTDNENDMTKFFFFFGDSDERRGDCDFSKYFENGSLGLSLAKPRGKSSAVEKREVDFKHF
ncbi:MAG: MFS transporter [Clostridiales bacterium]|nr:MFS transporter [Clostridiales bacterium]